MPTLELTRAEIIAEMERVAAARGRGSAADIVRRYHAGRLERPGEVADLLVLSDLLAPNDPYLSD